MALLTPSEKVFQLDQNPKHIDFFTRTESGKSVLVTPLLFEELLKNSQDVKDYTTLH
ncbi:MAG: hypothetical protein HC851_18600 [Acaryochloris sp. RU_4_1]|nr:hypothetical protein [Acaryochloris sp. RU_4_1]